MLPEAGLTVYCHTSHFCRGVQLNQAPLVERLRHCLEQSPAAVNAGHGQAAVVLALTDEPEPRLLLIRRSLNLSLHPGEIALPGGKLEPGDIDLRAAAVREAWEEVALPPDQFVYCGCLTPRLSMSGLGVTGFVGVIPPALPLRADPSEVDELIHVPLAYFSDPARLRVDRFWRGGAHRATARFHHDQFTIWGMTASFIVDLVNRFYNAGLVWPANPPGARSTLLTGDTA
jgi:8-oxo-dGTP pyrophosphatase MutT (NUDIX family)